MSNYIKPTHPLHISQTRDVRADDRFLKLIEKHRLPNGQLNMRKLTALLGVTSQAVRQKLQRIQLAQLKEAQHAQS